MTHPYRELVEQEVTRAEGDLTAFRSRAITVVTTSSGVVTLLTGLVTFGASKSEGEAGIPDSAIVAFAVAFVLLLVAAVLALLANAPGDIQRPGGQNLADLTTPTEWGAAKPDEQERLVAEVLVVYLRSLRELGDTSACFLNWAIWLQIAGLAATAVAGFLVVAGLN